MLKKVLSVATVIAVLAAGTTAFANEHEAKAKALAEGAIKAWVNNPVIINGIKAQNEKHMNLTQADIDALDAQWRAGDETLINSVLNNEVSTYLKQVESEGAGMYTEIFVMDNKGLNVGQSTKTSDYWQGDEDKWQKTFLIGPDALHLGEIESDESSQTFQMHISLPVVDNGEVIGTATVGVNAEQFE